MYYSEKLDELKRVRAPQEYQVVHRGGTSWMMKRVLAENLLTGEGKKKRTFFLLTELKSDLCTVQPMHTTT